MNHSFWLFAALAGVLLAGGAWLGNRIRRWLLRRQLARRFSHARQSEERARGWLERNGFTVLDEQVHRPSMFIVDGEELPFVVRADYLAERDGVRAVVEVKTGAAAKPASRETRRQILEYAWVYEVDTVYLFDADEERLHQVTVPRPADGAGPPGRRMWPIAVAFAGGVLVCLAATWWSR